MKKLLSIAACLFLACSLFAGEYPEISIADLKAAIAAKTVTLIDVNGTKSYQEGHIPGAVDYATVKANLAKALPANKGALVVAYCGSPKCNMYQTAAKAAADLGYTNVKHLKAGISGWKAAKESVETAKAK
jgi:rhodanese-related sulfurtransferase